MLDNILNVVKDVALEAVRNSSDVPNDKKDLVVDTATSAIAKGLTSNLGGLGSLLSGGGNSSIMNSIQESVVSSLMKKVGIESNVASGLVSAILPAVVGALTSKIGSTDDNGFSLESVLGALGGDKKKSGIDGVLGIFGKLFG